MTTSASFFPLQMGTCSSSFHALVAGQHHGPPVLGATSTPERVYYAQKTPSAAGQPVPLRFIIQVKAGEGAAPPKRALGTSGGAKAGDKEHAQSETAKLGASTASSSSSTGITASWATFNDGGAGSASASVAVAVVKEDAPSSPSPSTAATAVGDIKPAEPKAEEEEGPVVPVDVSLLLDVSGSMDGLPLELLKESAELVLEDTSLGHKDTVGLMSFNNNTRTLAARAPLTPAARDAALGAVKELTATAGTALYRAVVEGVAGFASAPSSGTNASTSGKRPSPLRSKALIVFSDGQDTSSGSVRLSDAVAAAVSARLPVHTVGLGPGHDVNAMTSLARSSGGLYVSITDNERISDAMAVLLERAQGVQASEATLRLELPAALVAAGASIDVGAATSPFAIAPHSMVGGRITGISIQLGDFGQGELREVAIPVLVPTAGDPTADATASRDPAGAADEDPMNGTTGVAAAAVPTPSRQQHPLATPGQLTVLTGTVIYTSAATGAPVAVPVTATVTVGAPATGDAAVSSSSSGGDCDGPFTPGFGVSALNLRASADMAASLDALTSGDRHRAEEVLRASAALIENWGTFYGTPSNEMLPVRDGVLSALADLRGGQAQTFATTASAMAAQSSAAASASGGASQATDAVRNRYMGSAVGGRRKAAVYNVSKAAKRGYY